MADQIMTATAENAAIVPEIWSQLFYPTLVENLPFISSVSTDYQGEIQALGDTVHIPYYPQFDEAEVLAEGAKSDADAVTAQAFQLVINANVVKDFIVTKRSLMQSIPHVQQLRMLAMHAVMKKMQSLIIAEIVPSASAPDHSIAFDTGTTLVLADLLEGKELLDEQNVPDDGSRQIIMDAPQWNDLFNITGFTSRDFIPAGSPTTTGAFSTNILGFKPQWTSVLSNKVYMFHPSFMQIAVQQAPAVSVYDMGGDGVRAQRVNMDVLFGYEQVDGLRVVSIG